MIHKRIFNGRKQLVSLVEVKILSLELKAIIAGQMYRYTQRHIKILLTESD